MKYQFYIIDDEVISDKFETCLEHLTKIYESSVIENQTTNTCKYYLVHKNDIGIQECDISNKLLEKTTSINVDQISDDIDEIDIICSTSGEITKHIKDNNDNYPLLISFDLKDGQGDNNDFTDELVLLLKKKMNTLVLVLTGESTEYKQKLEELEKNYPYFCFYEKINLSANVNTIANQCKAIKYFKESIVIINDNIKSKENEIYDRLFKHADKVTKESASRYISNIIKESLYDGKYLETKHQHFEIYIPIHEKDIELVCVHKKDEKDSTLVRKIDSHVRYGLIITHKETKESYIYISPSCNMHKISEKSICHIQLLHLEISMCKPTDTSLYLCHIPKYNDPGKWWIMNYTQTQVVTTEAFCKNYQKEAILIEGFAKDIQHQFASYFGRQGRIDLV